MHPIIDGLFNKMLEELLANAEREASYEIYDIYGNIGALLDTVNCYYNNWAVKPIEALIKEYSGKTVGELRSRINVVTYWEELSWQLTCYTKDYEATKEFVDPIVQTIAKRVAMASFIEGCLRSLPADQIIDEDMEYFLLEVARYVGIFMESNAEYWVDSRHTVISESTQKVMDAHREEIEQYRNSQMALERQSEQHSGQLPTA